MANILANQLGAEICKVLGIDDKRVTQIVINLKAGSVATIAFKMFIQNSDKIGRTIWRKYKILPLEQPKNSSRPK